MNYTKDFNAVRRWQVIDDITSELKNDVLSNIGQRSIPKATRAPASWKTFKELKRFVNAIEESQRRGRILFGKKLTDLFKIDDELKSPNNWHLRI